MTLSATPVPKPAYGCSKWLAAQHTLQIFKIQRPGVAIHARRILRFTLPHFPSKFYATSETITHHTSACSAQMILSL